MSISKGLHGINKKIPSLSFERDMLSFSLQIASLFICVLVGIMWPIFGLDSTVNTVMKTIHGVALEPEDFSALHLSTILNFFIITFLVSNYLSSKKIRAFHNVIVSVITPIVGMMVFEFIWVFLTDVFHNLAVEGYWAITTHGLGMIDLRALLMGVILLPMSVFYLMFHVSYNKISLAPKVSINIALLSSFCVATFIIIGVLIFGTPTVFIRNSSALLLFAFLHATLIDARRGDFILDFETRKRQFVLLASIAAALFVMWVFLPSADVVKGTLWPQTIYAFYESGKMARIVYVQNDVIRTLNVLSKALTTGAVSLAIIPKIRVVA